jgi:osmotically-inducible protein OsmY
MRRFIFIITLAFVINTIAAVAQQKVSDDTIYDQVRRKLANDPDVKGAALEVEVKDGVVTLKGVLEKEKYKEKAEHIAAHVKGVKKVINQIEVKPRSA